MGAFHDAPAVIAAALDQLDHFPEILADIADPGLAGVGIEAEPPRIAKAVGPDFGPRARRPTNGLSLGIE